ncbi:hypothetical protein FS799_00895 [Agrobacterium vitis]|uniref:hypothetical protein n=1 Tax=Agrobacterium vitis TaxID=373 RepID=UPI001F34A1EB|nr:hypothetical protein [Agrobacterium vitis]MCE6073413.1 hypothetical protein [Agrobacterium vitis]
MQNDVTPHSPIRQYRADNGNLSLQAFGELFSPPVHASTVLQWERGRLTAKRAIEIEGVTGISRVSLLPEIFALPVREPAE